MTIHTTAALQAHAHALAKGFGARLIESDQLRPEEALALPHMGIALVGRIMDETTYAVALHELGHLAAACGSLRMAMVASPSGDVASLKRIEEEAAWNWAQHYALDWTPAMAALRVYAEGTYAAKPAPAPPPPSIDWSKWGAR